MVFRKIISSAVLLLLFGCSASTTNVGSLVLPTSNKKIDVVQHRTDGKGCTTGFVLQTYSQIGDLIDSKGGYGRSLGCAVVDGVIRSSGQVGAAALIADGIRHSGDTINNSNSQAQSSTNTNTNTATGGAGGAGYGGAGGQGGAGGGGGGGSNGGGQGGNGGQGNNGGGNGGGDGTNPGTGQGGGGGNTEGD
jgi:hypothetical protein